MRDTFDHFPKPLAGPKCPQCGLEVLSFSEVIGTAANIGDLMWWKTQALSDLHARSAERERLLASDLATAEEDFRLKSERLKQDAREESSRLKEEFQAKLAALRKQAGSTPIDSDEMGYLAFSGDPHVALRELYIKKNDQARADYEHNLRCLQSTYETRVRALRELVEQEGARDELSTHTGIDTSTSSVGDQPANRVAVVHCTACGHVVGVVPSAAHSVLQTNRLLDGVRDLEEAVIKMHRGLLAALEAVVGRLQASEAKLSAMNDRAAAQAKAQQIQSSLRSLDKLIGGE